MRSKQFSILYGIPDTTPEHKAVVGLYIQDSKSKSCEYSDELMCTGTLIHPQYVLTAAHCVAVESSASTTHHPVFVNAPCNASLKICLAQNEAACPQNLLDVDSIVYHSGYTDIYSYTKPSYYTSPHDIALIKLKNPVSSATVKPIVALPPWLGISRDEIEKDGLKAQFVGFGYDEHGEFGQKLEITVPVLDYCGGDDAPPGCLRDDIERVRGCHPNPQYCAEDGSVDYDEAVMVPYGGIFYRQPDGGPCSGDSGGPAFIKRDGKEYLAGVTSYGDEVCTTYGVSTTVQDHFAWILDQAPEIINMYPDVCSDQKDNDGNGKIDCEDDVCKAHTACKDPTAPADPSTKPEDNTPGQGDAHGSTSQKETKCNDDLDDDNDGLVDCDDPDCADFAVCNKSDSKKKDSCSTSPLTHAQTPFTALLAILFALGFAIRRRA